MKNQIVIPFENPVDDWIEVIERTLIINNIKDERPIALLIFKSLYNQINEFLQKKYYKPKNSISYRSSLVERLAFNGLKLQIQSNDDLWKILEYFTDIDDYSKAFDIEIIKIDKKKLMLEKIRKDEEKGMSREEQLMSKVNSIRRANDYPLTKEKHIDEILDILEDIIRGGLK